MTDVLDISVVVPVYNSAGTLADLYERVKKVMVDEGLSFEVLFVEDGGSTDTWPVLLELQKAHPGDIHIYRLRKNYGQNSATLCGINEAKGVMVITIDDDLQTPPEEISKLLKVQRETDCDVVFGMPEKQQQPLLRRMGSSTIKSLVHGVNGSNVGSSFRLLAKGMKEHLATQSHDHLFINQVLTWYTTDFQTATVDHQPRGDGKSGYTFMNLMGIAMRLIFYYTDLPLKVMIWTAGIISMVCFGFGIYYIVIKLTQGAVPGFSSTITAIFFASGFIMLSLSVLGVYINRIYAARVKKPAYAVKVKL